MERKATRPAAPTIEKNELKRGLKLAKKKNERMRRREMKRTLLKKIDNHVDSLSATSLRRKRARSCNSFDIDILDNIRFRGTMSSEPLYGRYSVSNRGACFTTVNDGQVFSTTGITFSGQYLESEITMVLRDGGDS